MTDKRIYWFWAAIALNYLNLLFMHYTCLTAGIIEDEIDITAIADNLLGVAFDVTFIFFLFYFFSSKRLKCAAVCTFCVTIIWAYCNVLYCRFFHHYISFSAITQTYNLLDIQMLKAVLTGVRWSDIFIIFYAFVAYTIIKHIKPVKNTIRKVLLWLFAIAIIDGCSYIYLCSQKPEYRYVSFFIQRFEHRQISSHLHLCSPNHETFRRGSIRVLLKDLIDNKRTYQLTEQQCQTILKYSQKAKPSIKVGNIHDTKEKNVIFIIVESYMSFTSDLRVNGREATPFMNALKHDSTVYYNGNMQDNTTIGESSDGQFIYMTGILPMRSVITITKARDTTLPGLPKMLLGKESRMIIPTAASMWNQDVMCRQYGFNQLFSVSDYQGDHDTNLNDKQVFQLAMEKDKTSKQPFISVILTMSMHQPYTEQIDPTFRITDDSMSNELACYLNACHYTDQQIAKYIQHLKDIGLYNNSLIIIAADHSVHNTDFGGVSKQIPLYIVNPGISRQKMWQGECNQLDIYTTLLDLMGCDSEWYGLGQSLASTNYSHSIHRQAWDVSDWIIMGDYFSKYKYE